MKKISFFLLIVLVGCSCVFLGFDYTHNIEPNHYYQVYLDDELIGTIKSKKELEKYIDKRGEYIKNKYKQVIFTCLQFINRLNLLEKEKQHQNIL